MEVLKYVSQVIQDHYSHECNPKLDGIKSDLEAFKKQVEKFWVLDSDK
jgi:histidine ammonia-lyase